MRNVYYKKGVFKNYYIMKIGGVQRSCNPNIPRRAMNLSATFKKEKVKGSEKKVVQNSLNYVNTHANFIFGMFKSILNFRVNKHCKFPHAYYKYCEYSCKFSSVTCPGQSHRDLAPPYQTFKIKIMNRLATKF